MGGFMFATCNRRDALEFLRVLYPDRTIEDSPECAGPLLDLVEKDFLRIRDPAMHGHPTVVQGKRWAESELSIDEALRVCQDFHQRVTA